MVIVTKVSLLLIFPPTKSEIIETTLCEDWFHYVSEIEGKTLQDPEKKCNLTTQSHKIQCIFLLEIQGKKALCRILWPKSLDDAFDDDKILSLELSAIRVVIFFFLLIKFHPTETGTRVWRMWHNADVFKDVF